MKSLENRLEFIIERILLLFSSLFVLITLVLLLVKYFNFITSVPYLVFGLSYFFVKHVFKVKLVQRIKAVFFVNSILILIHIILYKLDYALLLDKYLSLIYLIGLITLIMSFFMLVFFKYLLFVFTLYFLLLFTGGILFGNIMNTYYKYAWIEICVKNSKEINLEKGYSVIKTKDHCKCIYEKFELRYRTIFYFPRYPNYSPRDIQEITECGNTFLISDSISK